VRKKLSFNKIRTFVYGTGTGTVFPKEGGTPVNALAEKSLARERKGFNHEARIETTA